jgi:ubiquinone/menaquinone biosynthesis C-methylase UbiE
MTHDFSGNVARFTGFADVYDLYRPTPPAILADVLRQLSGNNALHLVVDLGSGTGLSTRYWANQAERVIGIEPAADMRHQAEITTQASHVTYQEGFSHATGLPNGCADIVTCAQSLHWMEPQTTFCEAVRILRPGGVFAAFDYDWPPTTSHWQADAAYMACMQRVRQLERSLPEQGVRQWAKEQHLERMQASQCFRFVKEIALHHVDHGNAERLVGLALSQGSTMTLLKNGFSDGEIGIETLRLVGHQTLGMENKLWYWASRLRFGIK